MTSKDLIKIATIIDAHGIKGEVKLLSFSENPDFFKTNPELSNASGTKKFSVKITGRVKDSLIAVIDGITDRNAAELLKNTELYIPASALPAPAEGEYYHSDLIGLEARLESGKKYGIITAIDNFGAGDILEITATNDETIMLPLDEPWVSEIDLEKGFVVVIPAEYY